jgi:hypothetical protein
MATVETTTALTDAGVVLASIGASVRAVLDYEPWAWSDSLDWNVRQKKLRDKYGQRGAIPKTWSEVSEDVLAILHPDTLRQCRELVRLGLEKKAIRLAYCGKLGKIFTCGECGRPGKKVAPCRNAMCLACAKKNFDALFSRYVEVDNLIPASVRSLPGWGWHVLDFSFRHDGNFPEQWELRAMVRVMRQTVQRAVREACPELCRARQGCRLRFNEDGSPMVSCDGWPIVVVTEKSAVFDEESRKWRRPNEDEIGSVRELVGWTLLFIDKHSAPDNEARKHGEHGKKKEIPARWELRFGYEFLRVREFGFDGVNAHFHGAYFGPPLDYWKDDAELKVSRRLICGGCLVEIFKEESRRPPVNGWCDLKTKEEHYDGGLGVESYTVYFEKARQGFRSVLAHALKYTEKIPASTPEKLARLERVLTGTRRVALLGAHYGVPLKPKPRDPKCPSCGAAMGRLEGLGLVPLSEIADLPDVVEEHSGEGSKLRESGADEFLDLEVRGP